MDITLGPRIEAGKQTVLTEVAQGCSETCNTQFSQSYSQASSLTTSQSWTYTIGGSVHMDMKAGVDFIVDSEVTAGFSIESSNAIADETQHSWTNTTTYTQTSTIGNEPGAPGVVTFTPSVMCSTAQIKCPGIKGAQPPPLTLCSPLEKNINGVKEMEGTYNVAYTY